MRRRTNVDIRYGVAAVELALISPLFFILIMGILEIGRGYDADITLLSSVRDAGRLAASDFEEHIPAGTTANAKVELDIRNFLSASGLPGSVATIGITHAGGELDGSPFDLESKENYMKMFRISVSMPYESVSTFPLKYLKGKTLESSIVFRKGKMGTISE